MTDLREKARAARALFWGAGVAGVVHALPSLYWALGGRRWLETVGPWAVEASRADPWMAAIVLGATAILKLIGALLPLAMAYGLVPWAGLWRALSWLAGVGLAVYGALHMASGALVVSGAVRPEGGYDHDAIVGHAVIWGPLFLVWGLLLTAALWMSRR